MLGNSVGSEVTAGVGSSAVYRVGGVTCSTVDFEKFIVLFSTNSSPSITLVTDWFTPVGRRLILLNVMLLGRVGDGVTAFIGS